MSWGDLVLSATLVLVFAAWSMRRAAADLDQSIERRRHLEELDRRTSGRRGLA